MEAIEFKTQTGIEICIEKKSIGQKIIVFLSMDGEVVPLTVSDAESLARHLEVITQE